MPVNIDEIVKAVQSRPRHELAEEANVSTTTLRKIAEGKVPTLGGSGNFRVRKLWAGSIVRLAQVFGQNPNDWLQAVDISPEESQDELGQVQHILAGASDILQSLVEGSPVRIGCSVYEPFHKEGDRNSFFTKYATRLIRAINPEWELRVTDLNPMKSHFRPEISGNPAESKHLHIGLLNNVHRTLDGNCEFIPIPGLILPLSAVYCPDRGRDRLSWTDCINILEQRKGIALVIKDEVAHDFLASLSDREMASGIKPLTFADRTEDPIAQIAENLIEQQKEEDKARRFNAVLFIADEETCRQVVKAGKGLLREVERDGGLEGYLPPAYQVSMVVSSVAPDWTRLLRLSQTESLFHQYQDWTASLYADTFAAFPGSESIPGARPARFCWAMADIPYASERFKRKFCHLLLKQLIARFSGKPELALDWFIHFTPVVWLEPILSTVDEHFHGNAAEIVRDLEQASNTQHKWSQAVGRARRKNLRGDIDILLAAVRDIVRRHASSLNMEMISGHSSSTESSARTFGTL